MMKLPGEILAVILSTLFILQQKLAWAVPVEEVKSPVLPPLEWFGEPRGGNPNDEAFYDVTYDEHVCPTGLRASAVRNYAYMGKVIKTMKPANGTDDCLRQCFLIPECRSVNVYTKRKHLCELNSEDQFDDPTKLVSISNSLYYDRIQCRGAQKPS